MMKRKRNRIRYGVTSMVIGAGILSYVSQVLVQADPSGGLSGSQSTITFALLFLGGLTMLGGALVFILALVSQR